MILFCSSFGHLIAQLKGYDDDVFDGSPAVISHIDASTGLGSVPEEYNNCNSNPPNVLFSVNFTSGLAYVGDTLYGLEWEGGSGPRIFLYRFKKTGICAEGERVGLLPVGITNLESLAYCPTTGDLYSTTFAFGTHLGGLVRIDRATGVGELVGGPMAVDVRIVGLTYDPFTDSLLGISSAFATRGVELLRINQHTGQETLIGPIGVAPNTFESLEIDNSGAEPILLAAGTQMYQLDPPLAEPSFPAGVDAVPATLLGGNYTGTIWALASGDLGAPPLYLFAAGTPCAPCADDDPQFDGLALTNLGETDANVNLELFLPSQNGGSPQGANQAALVLPPDQQVARLRTDLFEGEAREPAFIEMTGDTGSLGTFFQFGTGALSQLDGGVAITETATRFTFTRVFDGPGTFRGQDAATAIALFNPNDEPVTVDLTYLFPAPAGSPQAKFVADLEIPARSLSGGQPSEIFGAPVGGGVITAEITQGGGVLGFELIQLINQTTILGLNVATGNSGAVAYSAQLASWAGLFTSVNVHNSADAPRNVTLRAIGEDGGSLADPVQEVLQPGQTLTRDAADLFGGGLAGQSPAGEINLVGSLVVEADGDGLEGDVIFGDATNFQYAASLPLQTQTFEEALFNQVANIAGFFTGLAFFYPGDSQGATQGQVPDAEITIQVFLPDGTMVGQSVQTLAVGERLSQLVAQLVAEAVNLGGGYVRIFSTQPIIGQMLFGVVGPQGIQLFSAVPPTVIR